LSNEAIRLIIASNIEAINSANRFRRNKVNEIYLGEKRLV